MPVIEQFTLQRKIFRAIRSDELEAATRDGWHLELVHKETRLITRDEHGAGYSYLYRQLTSVAPTYHGNNSQPEPKSKIDIPYGDVLVFIVWKEAEQIDREAAASTRIHDLEIQVQGLTDKQEFRDQKIKELEGTVETVREGTKSVLVSLDEQTKMRHRLESGLAKIRKAIGDLEWSRILGLPEAKP